MGIHEYSCLYNCIMNRHFFTMWLCWMDVYYFTKIFTRSFCLVRNAAQGFTRRSPPIRCLDIFSNISLCVFISLSAGAVAGAGCTRRCHTVCTLYIQMDTLHIYISLQTYTWVTQRFIRGVAMFRLVATWYVCGWRKNDATMFIVCICMSRCRNV